MADVEDRVINPGAVATSLGGTLPQGGRDLGNGLAATFVQPVDNSGNPLGTSSNPLFTSSLASGTQPVSGSVAVSNFPTTQTVSGSVSVLNFASSQAVTGTFWQASQPITTDGTAATGVTQDAGGTGTIGWFSSTLKNLRTLNATLTPGQASSSASIPVVIASDQSTLPANLKQVGGSTFALGQASSSASLPVVLSSNQSNVPTNIAQIGGSNVNGASTSVANSFPVTTTLELGSANSVLTFASSTALTMASSTALLSSRLPRKSLTFLNTSLGLTWYLTEGQAALISPGGYNWMVAPGQTLDISAKVFTGSWNGICSGNDGSYLQVTERY
jgi:hypothetical protein